MMRDMLVESTFFGVMLSLGAYGVGLIVKKRFRYTILNPLLIAIVITMLVLIGFNIDYEVYNKGAQYLSYLLTPATVCLAIPLYEQLTLLKNNWKAILLGIMSGVLTSLISVWVLSHIWKLDYEEYVTLLPKSITTAIGMGVSEELGGYVTITVTVIIITGLFGNMIAEGVCKLFRIEDPIAKGVAIGSSAHAMGTTKAMEMGQIEGAMSSLSIAVAGLMTVVGVSIFAHL